MYKKDEKDIYVVGERTHCNRDHNTTMVEFESFDEAKKYFMKLYDEKYLNIVSIVKENCDMHSLCEEVTLDDEHESLDAFMEVLIERDCKLYKEGTEMLYHVFLDKKNRLSPFVTQETDHLQAFTGNTSVVFDNDDDDFTFS